MRPNILERTWRGLAYIEEGRSAWGRGVYVGSELRRFRRWGGREVVTQDEILPLARGHRSPVAISLYNPMNRRVKGISSVADFYYCVVQPFWWISFLYVKSRLDNKTIGRK
jgi:hypothetical protein